MKNSLFEIVENYDIELTFESVDNYDEDVYVYYRKKKRSFLNCFFNKWKKIKNPFSTINSFPIENAYDLEEQLKTINDVKNFGNYLNEMFSL